MLLTLRPEYCAQADHKSAAAAAEPSFVRRLIYVFAAIWNSSPSMMSKKLRSSIRFYIAVPEFILVLLVLALFWRPIANIALGWSALLSASVTPPAWISDVTVNVVANLIASAIVVLVAIAILKRRRNHALAGRFEAFDVKNGNEEAWGTVELRYPLMSAEPRMRMRLIRGDVILEGEGFVSKERHFIGHYRETSDIVRRRYGSFMMELHGANNAYSGKYLFVDPDTDEVTVGSAIWKRND